MNENNEAPAVGEVLKPTPGPWDVYEDRGWWHVARNPSAEYVGFENYNDIATMHFDISMVQGEQEKVQEANARLFTASCNSYQKHFPADPVTAAESDELGNVLAQNQSLRALVGELAEGLALVEKLEEIKNRQASAVGRRRTKRGIAVDKDEEALLYQALDIKAGEITDQIAVLIAKAKEAGL